MVSQMKNGAHDQYMSLEVKIPYTLPNPAVITSFRKSADII
jgi:hypothetical protein